MDKETAIYGTLVAALVAWIGKMLVPLLMRTLENSVASATASGGILSTVLAERDQWKKRYEDSDKALQEMREEWAAMKSNFDLMAYQLREARITIARMTGNPLPSEEKEIDQSH